ncbi:MAG: low molecular weight phosphotyrosine protein phosphatase [Rhizobiaceae bacterium]|nr:low molecular weight phosphotyrosine protein phosphatase [Rhizobiaceae bacterium]MCV0407659.1 low molecular weight phosphotyrosine protein phosphatase [Rhizobiaceae bacterium]
MTTPRSILFVCLGNICRSPLAEGVFRTVAAERGLDGLRIDSAGTGDWHEGERPDPRAIAIAAHHGIDISRQRARKQNRADFDAFDLILAMDRSNLDIVRAQAPAGREDRVRLYLDHTLGRMADVPDPYFGGPDEFASVYRMVHEASLALAAKLA